VGLSPTVTVHLDRRGRSRAVVALAATVWDSVVKVLYRAWWGLSSADWGWSGGWSARIRSRWVPRSGAQAPLRGR